VLEITEGEVIEDAIELGCTLNQFRARGLTVAIDDFGAGPVRLNGGDTAAPKYRSGRVYRGTKCSEKPVANNMTQMGVTEISIGLGVLQGRCYQS